MCPLSIGGMNMNIDIKTPGGWMLIDPDLFFPASRSDLLKLKKIIYDPYSGEGEAKAKEIFDYLYSEIQYLIDKEIAINSSYFPLEQHKDKLLDEWDLFYYEEHNKLLDKLKLKIAAKKQKYEKNIDLLRG